MIHTGVHVMMEWVEYSLKARDIQEYSLLFSTLAQLVRAAVTVSG